MHKQFITLKENNCRMETTPLFNVLIVGAGNIGALYDNPESDNFLTHAHAFSSHKGFELLGFVDIDKLKAEKAVSLWGGKVFQSIEEAFEKEKIDIVCVAVPDEYHYEILKKLSSSSVKLIFCEKPLVSTYEEAVEISAIYKENKIPICVNYRRRFVPAYEKIHRDIKAGEYGEYITGTGYYGKGLLHNGSHMIDLLRYFIGEIDHIKVIDHFPDFYLKDPSVSAILNFKNSKPFFMQVVDCRLYSIFELDLLFEKRRIRFKDNGFTIENFQIRENDFFRGYFEMSQCNMVDTTLYRSLFSSATNIFRYLTVGESLKCNFDDGYRTLIECINIMSEINRRG